jgi:hypothetical protein
MNLKSVDSSDFDEQYNFDVFAPFSPVIMRAIMPMRFVENINEYIDNTPRHRQKKLDYSSKLAGNIENETSLAEFIGDQKGFREFLIATVKSYLSQAPNIHLNQSLPGDGVATVRIEIQDIWSNEMRAGDYSPAHFHTNCQMSCVGFLRNPDNYEEELAACAPHKRTSGCLQLIDGRTVFGGSNMILVEPAIGKLVLFPAWMLHCVYPFRSRGLRRTFSANFALKYIQNHQDDVGSS